jgi:hypothetical protein
MATTTSNDDEKRQLRRTCQDLVREFGDRLSEAEVQARFEEILHSFDGAPVRNFVPVLAARAARERLRAQTSAA